MGTDRKSKLITDNQLKGNWGEQFIVAELASQGCLVRYVPQGHDSGIDLYCEATWQGIPWLHFWCQVKTSQEWKGAEESVTESFKRRDIDYWLKQPIPVFIFLVPDVRDKRMFPYYVCSPLNIKNGSTTSFLKIENRRNLFRFLHDHLVTMTHEWDLRRGKVSPLPHPRYSNVIEFLPGATQKYEKIIFDSLCWTLWRLSSDILFPEPTSESAMLYKTMGLTGAERSRLKHIKPYIEALSRLIDAKGHKHHEGYYILGIFFELEEKFQKALGFFEKSLSIMDGHLKRNSCASASFHHFRHKIEKSIQRVGQKMRSGQ
jgi:hypothetical protein